MSSRHLRCKDCRIRMRADMPEIALFEGRCPLCGAELEAVPFPSGVIGFRSLDLDELAPRGSSGPLPDPAPPGDLLTRREGASSGIVSDFDRWSDDGGPLTSAR